MSVSFSTDPFGNNSVFTDLSKQRKVIVRGERRSNEKVERFQKDSYKLLIFIKTKKSLLSKQNPGQDFKISKICVQVH